MADGRIAEESAATDLKNSRNVSRVPRERHKNRVDSHAVSGWCLCSISSSTTTTTTTATPLPLVHATSSTSTMPHRRRIIGDASDDRRRDGVGWCIHDDGFRYNDNNDNNESDDVVPKVDPVVEEKEEEQEGEEEEQEEEDEEEEEVEVEGAKGAVAVAAVAATTATAESSEAAVVSRLKPAASEDRSRSGQSLFDVVVAAGVATDNAASVARSTIETTRRNSRDKYRRISRNVECKDNDEYRWNDDTVNQVVGYGRAVADCGASGANGERNSDYENVENEMRRNQYQKRKHRDDETDETNNKEELKRRENDRETDCNCENGVRYSSKRNSVGLVERCISNNNCVRGSGFSVHGCSTDDKLRVLSLNFGYKRLSSDSLVTAEEEDEEELTELEGDIVLGEKSVGTMQSENLMGTGSSRKEMAEREIDDGVVARLGSPFKGQIRTAEDTLVGPCGKKRCADRYDSSESSDR